MSIFAKSLAAGFLAVSMAATPVVAANPMAGEKLAEDQTFTYSTIDEISSLDPQIVEDVSGSNVARDLFEGLLNQDAEGNLVPGVAESWEANDEKNLYTFHLRDNAKWSDGTPVTANDFVYAWRRLADPKTASPYSWFAEIMAIDGVGPVLAGEADPSTLGVKAIDDHTFQVKLSASLPYFAAMTTHPSTFPTPQAVIEKFGTDWTKPENIVSNGAYVLTEHIPNERMVRERNPMYWDNEHTVIDKTVLLVINDENAAHTRYLAGELDLGPVPTGQYKRLKAEYPDETHSVPSLCTYYYNYNMRDSGPEALKDVRVRQALSYAIDRSIITDNILQAGQIPAFTFTPGATAGFTVPKVAFGEMTQAERDAKAVELLAAAGYGKDNPLKVEVLYNTSEGHKKIAIAITQMWKQKLGVEATLANMEWKTFLQNKSEGNFDVARAGWCGDYNEASTFLDLLTTDSGYNDSKYSNPEVDRLMAEAKTMDDPSANYTKVEEIIAEDMPVIPVYHYASVLMLKPNVKGWPFQNVEGKWYSRELYKTAE